MSPDLSVVVPVYNEHPRNLAKLIERLDEVIRSLGLSHEVVFVNDGSGSETSEALRQIAWEVEHVKLIELSRNFGQPAALSAGLKHADGEAMINIDSDLQDPPELIADMVKFWRQGFEVVYAQRSTRRDRLAKKITAFLYYRLLRYSSGVRIPLDTGEYRLMDRRVVDAFNTLSERTRFVRGLVPWLGFKQTGIPMDRGARVLGKSAFTPKRLIALALDGLVSFSAAPLLLIPIAGLAVLLIGLIALLIQLAGNVSGAPASNNALLSAALIILSGVQIVCTGVVAVYLSKVFDEVRARPIYIISQKLGLGFASNRQDNRPSRQTHGPFPASQSFWLKHPALPAIKNGDDRPDLSKKSSGICHYQPVGLAKLLRSSTQIKKSPSHIPDKEINNILDPHTAPTKTGRGKSLLPLNN